MLVSSALGKVAPFVPVVGSVYGFGKTCMEVYSASSPSGAIVTGDPNFAFGAIECATEIVIQ